MSLGFRAEANNNSGVISVAGVDQVVINNAGDVAATTFTGALVGNAATATNLTTTTGAAPVYGARAWVNFDGTRDDTNNISTANTNRLMRGNGNVSSVLRNGLGDYTVNFTVAMPDANYCVSLGGSRFGTTTNDNFGLQFYNAASGDIRINSFSPVSVGNLDAVSVTVAIFR